MIEMRYIKRKDKSCIDPGFYGPVNEPYILVLQYRYYALVNDFSQSRTSYGVRYQWSEWKDVQVMEEA